MSVPARVIALFDRFDRPNAMPVSPEESALIDETESALISTLPYTLVTVARWFRPAARLLVLGRERAGLNTIEYAACKGLIAEARIVMNKKG